MTRFSPEPLPDALVEPLVRTALAEDLGRAGDITSAAVIPPDSRALMSLVAREAGVLSGVVPARLAWGVIDAELEVSFTLTDGAPLAPGSTIGTVSGRARSILAGERVALNFLGHLSGIATQTKMLVEAVAHTTAQIADSRKTTPGLRALEKAAVVHGGGMNHRFGLDDAILIKDNHIAVAGGVVAAVEAARSAVGHLTKIEVEVDTIAQVRELVALHDSGSPSRPRGADVVMLDNMSPELLREAVALVDGRMVIEASGGVRMETAAAIAESGVDVVSVGRITHSAPCLDIGLDAQ